MNMLLVVDVGNTQTVVGIYEDLGSGAMQVGWRISTAKQDAPDDILAKLYPLANGAGIQLENVDSMALASVVPALTASWVQVASRIHCDNLVMCNAKTAAQRGLFSTNYPNPHEIGSDRIADAIAARHIYGCPVIVADFGTATNFEVIDADGVFVGGVLAPGIMTGANALISHATRLAATDMVAPPYVIGTSTEEALRSGIIFGEAARTDGILQRICEQLHCECKGRGGDCSIVATGGLAELVASESSYITDISPELTLEGLRLLAITDPQL